MGRMVVLASFSWQSIGGKLGVAHLYWRWGRRKRWDSMGSTLGRCCLLRRQEYKHEIL